MTRKLLTGLTLALYVALSTGCGGDDNGKNNAKVGPDVKIQPQPATGGKGGVNAGNKTN
jgi:hypothetical protein